MHGYFSKDLQSGGSPGIGPAFRWVCPALNHLVQRVFHSIVCIGNRRYPDPDSPSNYYTFYTIIPSNRPVVVERKKFKVRSLGPSIGHVSRIFF